MDSNLLRLAARLLDEETPYAVATVVRRERPSSAASGNTAVITADGTVHGWIGGSCTLPEVTRHAIASLAERQPRLLAFGGTLEPRGDVISIPMSCGSEGKVEVHINPVYPAPRLVVAGDRRRSRTRWRGWAKQWAIGSWSRMEPTNPPRPTRDGPPP